MAGTFSGFDLPDISIIKQFARDDLANALEWVSQ